MFSILESVAFDTGYAGSNGLEPQSWVNGNGTSYIYFGSGEFDGQVYLHYQPVNPSSSCPHTLYCFGVRRLLLILICVPSRLLLLVSLPCRLSGLRPRLFGHPLHAPLGLRELVRRWPLAHLLRLSPAVIFLVRIWWMVPWFLWHLFRIMLGRSHMRCFAAMHAVIMDGNCRRNVSACCPDMIFECLT